MTDDPLSRLRANLAEAIELLTKYEAGFWAKWLATDLTRIDAWNSEGLRHLLAAYGGMGSFNDLVLYSKGGPDVQGDAADIDDMRLSALRSQIWQDATDLLRSTDQTGILER